jgi:ribosomal protein S14
MKIVALRVTRRQLEELREERARHVRYLTKREIMRNYIFSLSRQKMREYAEKVIKDRCNYII